MHLNLLAVDRPVPGFTKPVGEGIQFEPTGREHPHLYFWYADPLPPEVDAFRNAQMWLGLRRISGVTSFLLIGLPGLIGPDGWGDAPFTHHRGSERIERIEPSYGRAFTVVLADAQTGMIAAMRSPCSVSPEFYGVLVDLVEEQSQHEYDKAMHQSEIAASYQRFPSASAMVRGCLICEPVGVDFDLARAKRIGTRAFPRPEA